jgi:uncharacterized spore protein YtfJ
MNIDEVLAQARDSMTVRRVYGEPIERDGTTVIPEANVRGGGGGGGGEGPAEMNGGKGEGAGFGLTARPAGAYVIRDGVVTWHPAIDPTRIVVGGQIVALVAILAVRSILRHRHR